MLIAVGAAIGAPLRYLTDRLIQARHDSVFPWGTLAVNVVGSFVLGVVVAASADGRLDDDMVALVGTGFCGSLTTYSTFGYETVRLLEDGARRYAFVNVCVGIVGGLGAAAAGWVIGSA